MEFTELEKRILKLLEDASGEMSKLQEIPESPQDDISLIAFHLSSLTRIILARAVFREVAKKMGLLNGNLENKKQRW